MAVQSATPMPPPVPSSQIPTPQQNMTPRSNSVLIPLAPGNQLPDSSQLSTPQNSAPNNSVSITPRSRLPASSQFPAPQSSAPNISVLTRLPSIVPVPSSSQFPMQQRVYQSIPNNTFLSRPTKRNEYFQIASNSTSHKRVKPSPQYNRRKRAPVKSWTNDHNQDGKSSLDLIVRWLTSEGNYESWRDGKKPKCQVAESINTHLTENGIHNRNGRGVEQQIAMLERKFCKALAWKNQTGQAILDDAERAQQNQEVNRQRAVEQGVEANEDEQTKDLVQAAKNKVSDQLQKICRFFFALEPIFSQYPNLTGRARSNQEIHRDGSHPDISPSSSVDPSEERQQYEAQGSNIVQSMPNALTTGESLSSTHMMNTSDNAQSVCLPEEPFHPDNQFVDTIYTHLDYGQPLSDRSGELTFLEIERYHLELEIQKHELEKKKIREEQEIEKFQIEKEKRMIEIAKAKIDLEASEQSMKNAPQRQLQDQARQAKQEFAKMVQDFIKAGLAFDDAMKATTQILGPLNDNDLS